MNAYSFVLLAVTVPQLFYIFMGLVIISVPAAFIWDKYVQPNLDAKKRAQKEAEKAEEVGEIGEAEGVGELEPGEVAATDGLLMEAEGELAMPGEEEEAASDMFAEDAEPPKDLFGDAGASDDLGEVAFEEALPADAFAEEADEKPEG